VLMLLLGTFMTLMGIIGLIYSDFHGPINIMFNLVTGTAMTFGGWKLFPVEKVNSQESTYWEIEEGKVDSAKFFKAISKNFSFATTFFAEGNSISDDVKECYKLHREEGNYLPQAQTIFPISKKFRCRFSPDLLADLTSLAKKHAEPELLDHLALYKGEEEVLFWHDAFANAMLVSRHVPEHIVSAFAAELELRYR